MSQPAPPDAAIRAEILALRAAGAAFHRIAARLNGRGLKGQNGGRWYAASVRRVALSPAPQELSHTHRSFSGEVHARINATPVAAGLIAD
jgi:hypothetical protein